jgi:O-antigen/teichoic acid export membrane protein
MARQSDSQGATPRLQDDSPAPPASGIKRQFFWSVIPLLSVTAINLVSVPLFIKYLGDTLYALWGYIAIFTGMFGFADLGLGVAVGRYIGVALGKGDHGSVREYWGTGNLIALPLLGLMGLVFAGLGAAFGPVWYKIAPENVALARLCFIMGGLNLFLNYYGQFWNILSQAHLDFKFIGLLRTVVGMLQVLPAIAIAWLTKNPFLIIAWSTFTALLQLLIFYWHSRRSYDLGLELRFSRRARVNEMAAYTGKTFASLIFGALLGSIDQFILGRFAARSPVDFNNYTRGAANIGMRLQSVGSAIMGPVFHNTNRALGDGRKASSAAIYNESFDFVFSWYLLVAVWAAIWHPVLLRLWLGAERGMQVAPLFTPVVTGSCLTALAGISSSQLASLNRLGTAVGFSVAAGALAIAGVYVGWNSGGIVGVAYGFLLSRVAYLAQDLFTIRLIQAGGWLSGKTWRSVGAQVLVGAVFASAGLFCPRNSLVLVVPALLHGALVGGWLARPYLRKFISNPAPA